MPTLENTQHLAKMIRLTNIVGLDADIRNIKTKHAEELKPYLTKWNSILKEVREIFTYIGNEIEDLLMIENPDDVGWHQSGFRVGEISFNPKTQVFSTYFEEHQGEYNWEPHIYSEIPLAYLDLNHYPDIYLLEYKRKAELKLAKEAEERKALEEKAQAEAKWKERFAREEMLAEQAKLKELLQKYPEIR